MTGTRKLDWIAFCRMHKPVADPCKLDVCCVRKSARKIVEQTLKVLTFSIERLHNLHINRLRTTDAASSDDHQREQSKKLAPFKGDFSMFFYELCGPLLFVRPCFFIRTGREPKRIFMVMRTYFKTKLRQITHSWFRTGFGPKFGF